jgi:hypothetical protein
MCLGSAAPDWQPPIQKVIEPGPESPNDKVNNMDVENINDRSRQTEFRQGNKGTTATKQKGQSSSKLKAY